MQGSWSPQAMHSCAAPLLTQDRAKATQHPQPPGLGFEGGISSYAVLLSALQLHSQQHHKHTQDKSTIGAISSEFQVQRHVAGRAFGYMHGFALLPLQISPDFNLPFH